MISSQYGTKISTAYVSAPAHILKSVSRAFSVCWWSCSGASLAYFLTSPPDFCCSATEGIFESTFLVMMSLTFFCEFLPRNPEGEAIEDFVRARAPIHLPSCFPPLPSGLAAKRTCSKAQGDGP